MKKPNHYFVLVNPRSNFRVRQVRIRSVSIYLLLFCLFAGTIGFSRMLWFSASFGLGKIGLHNERCENDGLKAKIDFLDKCLVKESLALDSMVTFEDRMRLSYGMNSISADVRQAGIGGTPSAEEKADGAYSDPLLKKSAAVQESLSILLRRAQLQNTTFDQMGEYVGHLYRFWSQSPSIRPAIGTVTSGFGYRPDPITGEVLFHDGLDIASQIGTPVFAPADGIVRATGVMQDFGNAVIIGHPECKVETIYGHLNQFTVQAFQNVRRGELIGYVGNSGKSTGPHLHYEIRKNGSAISPVPFILPPDQIAD
jgi:murein DD-endopeptidase MepM/ murein hydrolase activator NlpD